MSIFILLFLLFYSYGDNPQLSLMPLPNTEYISVCNKQTRILRTGTLNITKKNGSSAADNKHYSMNAEFRVGAEIRKLRMEPWNRLAFVSSIIQTGNNYSETKISSGNLEKVELIVGSHYSGQLTERRTENNQTRTFEWKVDIKIESLSKVKFKDEEYLSYKIKTTRTQALGGSQQFSINAVYAPKLGQFLSMSQTISTFKLPMNCEIADVKSLSKKN